MAGLLWWFQPECQTQSHLVGHPRCNTYSLLDFTLPCPRLFVLRSRVGIQIMITLTSHTIVVQSLFARFPVPLIQLTDSSDYLRPGKYLPIRISWITSVYTIEVEIHYLGQLISVTKAKYTATIDQAQIMIYLFTVGRMGPVWV